MPISLQRVPKWFVCPLRVALPFTGGLALGRHARLLMSGMKIWSRFSECRSLIGALVWEAETWSALHRLNKLESVFPCDSVDLNLQLGWSQRFLGSLACLRGFSAVSLFTLGGRGLVNLANFRYFLKLVKLFVSLLKRASLQDRMVQFQRELLYSTFLSLNY